MMQWQRIGSDKILVEVDAGIWVDPLEVSGLEPGRMASVIRVYLLSGVVIGVKVGPDRVCQTASDLVSTLSTAMMLADKP
jgi:hypothetical protein